MSHPVVGGVAGAADRAAAADRVQRELVRPLRVLDAHRRLLLGEERARLEREQDRLRERLRMVDQTGCLADRLPGPVTGVTAGS